MNKVLVRVYIPAIEKQYEIWIPSHRRIYNLIYLLVKSVNELNDGCYSVEQMPMLYDKSNGRPYDINLSIKESTIRNGTELILI